MFSLLSLLDDIAATLDDVAVMTKVALKKTSAIMSDDLAVNSAVLDGVHPERELPVVWKIFLGSLINKVISIVIITLLLSLYPPALDIILLIGGLYLCYEGAHKVFEKIGLIEHAETKSASDKDKIKGAIKTDLILSFEILVIAQSSIEGEIMTQLLSLAVIGVLASLIIYGLVAVLVKIDDLGLYLIKKGHPRFGMSLVRTMPYLMKTLGFVGTVAMFLVGGGIIDHTFHMPVIMPSLIWHLLLGFAVGTLVLGMFYLGSKLRGK